MTCIISWHSPLARTWAFGQTQVHRLLGNGAFLLLLKRKRVWETTGNSDQAVIKQSRRQSWEASWLGGISTPGSSPQERVLKFIDELLKSIQLISPGISFRPPSILTRLRALSFLLYGPIKFCSFNGSCKRLEEGAPWWGRFSHTQGLSTWHMLHALELLLRLEPWSFHFS